MIEAVFLDLDDTLEDWNPAREAIRKKISGYVNKKFGVGKERFLKTFHDVEYSFIGKSLKPLDYGRKKWFAEAFRRLGIKAGKEDIERLEKLYWETGLAKIRANPGAAEFLKGLKKCRKIIVTDSDGDADNRLKNRKIMLLGIRKYFDMVVTSNDTGRNKPDKKLWKKAIVKFGLDPKKCVMIGDKPEMLSLIHISEPTRPY